MKISNVIVAFDAADIAAESTFWARLLGGTVDVEDDDWHIVRVDGKPVVCFQLAPDHVPPQWPGGPQHQQAHLDVYVDDLAEADVAAIAAGATLLKAADDPDAEEGFQVYADPAGHPFCLCWG